VKEDVMQEKFTIFPRPSKKYKQVYYVRFRDPENGERMSAVSSGHTTKSGARNWAIEQIQAGNIDRKSKVNFSVYTTEWFVWGKCPYIKLMLSKGHRFSRSYAENRRGYLINHLQPFFGNMKLGEIGVTEAEGFLANMQTKGYSSSAVNNAFSTFSIIMQEAVRQGILLSNPLDKVKCVVKTTSIKEIIPLDTAKTLFNPCNIGKCWDNSIFHYCFNLVAFTTGLRQAEILALRKKDIKKGYLEVNHTWDRKYGLKAPKYESNRVISLPDFAMNQLNDYCRVELGSYLPRTPTDPDVRD
jgi:integrase